MAAPLRIETPAAPPSTGFRSQGLLAGGFLFASGQIGAPLEAPGRIGPLPPTLEAQVDLCLRHLEQVTLAGGATRDRVVEVSAFLVPAGQAALVRGQVEAFLGRPCPLFRAEQVADVALHGLLELDWIALVEPACSPEEATAILAPFGAGEGCARSGPFVILNGVTGEGATLGEQTRNALERADDELRRQGSALSAAVKLAVHIADFESYPQFNEVTREVFREGIPPARSVVVAPAITGASLLRLDILAVPVAP